MKERSSDRAMPHEFPAISFQHLEVLASGDCPCCGDPFCAAERPDLTSKCHTGPVFLSYWNGWLYLECGAVERHGNRCRKPIGRIKVEGA